MADRASSPLRVQLLGPVRAWRDDEELDLGSPRQRAVFAILALRRNQAVSRAELVDGIWGDEPPARATGILYTYVSGLRRALEPARGKRVAATVLASVDAGYSLRLDAEQLDEQRFHQQRRLAQQCREQGEPDAALAAVNAAIALWQGPALAGLAGPFAELHRARLDELRLTVLEWQCELRLALGEHTAAIAGLTALVDEYPRREGPRGLLMTALHRSGRRDEALAVFAETERVLVCELGIEPGPALRRIHERILAGEPLPAKDVGTHRESLVPAAIVTTAPDDARPVRPPVLVGRERELVQLWSTLAGLADGPGGCVWIEGEPGVGKSALLATALASHDASGHQVIWTSGDELAWGGEPGVADPRAAAVDRLLQLVEQTCARTPLLIVVDDLDQADDTGLLAWSGLARRTRQLPLVLLGACRTIPANRRMERPRTAVVAAGGRILRLGPLTAADVVEFAARRVGGSPGPALSEFLSAAAGNPRYVGELLDMLVQAGALHTDAGMVDIEPASSFDRGHAVTTIVERRLDVLSPQAQELLRHAALLGAEFDLGEVATIARGAPAELVGAVDEATSAGVLVDTGEHIAFRDPAFRLALYEQRPLAVRTALHREAAETLAAGGVPPERVARQLLAAQPAHDQWTVRWLLDNVDTVARRDPQTAVNLLCQMVTNGAIRDDDRDALATALARWLVVLEVNPDTATRDLLATVRNAEHTAATRYFLAYATYRAGDTATALASLREVEQDPSVPELWKVRCQVLRARFARTTTLDGLTTAKLAADALLARATSVADPLAIAMALQELWYVATADRDHTAALAYIDRALAAGSTDADLEYEGLQGNLLDNRVFTLQNLDRLDEASAAVTRMYAMEGRVHRRPSARPHVVSAALHYWLGRWDDVLVELGGRTGQGPEEGYSDNQIGSSLVHHGLAALIAAHRGDAGALRSHLAAVDTVPLDNSVNQENSTFLLMARSIDAGQRGGVRAELDVLAPLLDPDYGLATLRHVRMPDVLRLALAAGDHERAERALEIAKMEAAREKTSARAHTALQRCLALIDGDPEPLLTVADHYRTVGRSIEMAATLADAAVLFAQRDQVERAQDALADAVTTFTDLGATLDIARVEDRLRRYGIHRTAPTDHHPAVVRWSGLSEAEQRIAGLVAAGRTNTDIAGELALSRRTVQLHLSHVMRKLGAGSRAELVITISTALPTSRPDAGTTLTS